jgi:hypothetical protein
MRSSRSGSHGSAGACLLVRLIEGLDQPGLGQIALGLATGHVTLYPRVMVTVDVDLVPILLQKAPMRSVKAVVERRGGPCCRSLQSERRL